MVTGPATFVVMLVAGLLLVAGVIVLKSGSKRGSGEPSRLLGGAPVCSRCGHQNAARASYCAQCGNKLHGQSN